MLVCGSADFVWRLCLEAADFCKGDRFKRGKCGKNCGIFCHGVISGCGTREIGFQCFESNGILNMGELSCAQSKSLHG